MGICVLPLTFPYERKCFLRLRVISWGNALLCPPTIFRSRPTILGPIPQYPSQLAAEPAPVSVALTGIVVQPEVAAIGWACPVPQVQGPGGLVKIFGRGRLERGAQPHLDQN